MLAFPSQWRTVPLAGWIVFVSYACMSPPSDLPSVSLAISDKLAHATLFGVLAFLALRAWTPFGPIRSRPAWQVFLIATAWGYYLECLQGLTPDRAYDLMDLLFDGVGAGIGVAVTAFWRSLPAGGSGTASGDAAGMKGSQA
jgi:VanZ family protein